MRVTLPARLHSAGAPLCLLPVSRLGRLPGSQAAPLQLHCSSTALSGGWLGALAHIGCGVAAALAARVDPHRVDAERVGGGEHGAFPAEQVEDT